MIYQRRKEGEKDWENLGLGVGETGILPRLGYEYRMIEEPPAPKWPQTTMTPKAMSALHCNDPTHTDLWKFANGVIDHECSTGALVPADKVREISAEAYAQGTETGERDPERDLKIARAVAAYCGSLLHNDTLSRIIGLKWGG